MVTIFDVPSKELINRIANYLKENKIIEPPPWALFIKTGAHKERPPTNPEWWYIRCASILRKIYIHGPIGVSRLRKMYGGRRRRGLKPPRFYKGSGNIVRKALQQLEKAGLVEKINKKGRVLSSKGRSFLDNMAQIIIKESKRRVKNV
jgi:small subunit ribosomal protein S19e